MVSLTEILNSESLILVDSSIISEGVEDFSWDLYNARIYSCLNCQKIESKISQFDKFRDIIISQNVYTIKGVTKEIREFERILSDKIKYLSSLICPKKYKTKTKIEKASKKPRGLLLELQKEAYETRRLAESKEINRFSEFRDIRNLEYSSLLDMVNLVSNETKLKIDTNFLRGEHEIDRSKESDTDEKLVATLYWLSLFSDKNPCLLSQDIDFVRLLGVVTRMIGSDSFLPYNKIFRERILQNPFKLYIKDINKDEHDLKIVGSEIRYDKEFRIGGISEERSEKIKQEIEKTWREFSAEKLQVNVITRQYI